MTRQDKPRQYYNYSHLLLVGPLCAIPGAFIFVLSLHIMQFDTGEDIYIPALLICGISFMYFLLGIYLLAHDVLRANREGPSSQPHNTPAKDPSKPVS